MPNIFEISIILITALLIFTCVALALQIKKQKKTILELNTIIKELPFNFAISNSKGETSFLKTSNPELDDAKSLSVFGHKECRLFKRSLDKLDNIALNQTELNCYSSANSNLHQSIFIKKILSDVFGKYQYMLTITDSTDVVAKISKAENAFKYEKLFRTALQMIAQDKAFDDYCKLILKNLTEWLSATRATVYEFNDELATPLVSFSKIKCDVETVKVVDKNSKMYSLLKKQKLIFYDQSKKNSNTGIDMIIENLEESKMKSSIILSILVEESPIGCICIDYFKNLKTLNDDQLSTIFTAANILKIAQLRKKHLENLDKSQENQPIEDSEDTQEVVANVEIDIETQNKTEEKEISEVQN